MVHCACDPVPTEGLQQYIPSFGFNLSQFVSLTWTDPITNTLQIQSQIPYRFDHKYPTDSITNILQIQWQISYRFNHKYLQIQSQIPTDSITNILLIQSQIPYRFNKKNPNYRSDQIEKVWEFGKTSNASITTNSRHWTHLKVYNKSKSRANVEMQFLMALLTENSKLQYVCS